MVKAAKEIEMENPREAEAPSTGATCSPPEEQAKKPSMLCFKKRKKSCKKGLTVKDACEGASEEKSQCVSADQEEAKASNPSRSSKGTWAAIKNLARPQRRQKSSSRKKVPSDSQVQLEVDAEDSCAQDLPKKRASSGVKMPCVRFSRGKKKPSPSEAVEESEGSVQANEAMGVVNKASEEPEDLAPTYKSESLSPVSAQEEKDMAKQEQHRMKEDQDTMKEDQDTVKEDSHTEKESGISVGKSEPSTEPTRDAEHSECTVQLEITNSETFDETAQDKLQEGSLPQTTDHVEGREVAPEAVSKDQPDNAPEITEWQEIPHICKEMPERDELEKSINLSKECKAEESVTDFSELASGGDAASVQETASAQDTASVKNAASVQDAASVEDAASVQECSSRQILEANAGAGVSIVITITEAEDSDNTDSDQGYEPSPVLHQKKQKGNKKSNRNTDVGQKEGPEAGGGPQAEEKGLGDQGHRTGEQYELLLIETASSLVKAAIQSSIEQLVNEMALEQNKHNSFL
ncbi:A-kinase anchor protein 5 [Onychostruthus taczanowskii]|uniref:A-kinase anchor protein 5 n=1 Tax=Onychostruthus taczanowskii TaxID=356909 RepID=UPI001B80CF7F|nr:A-kinase anchor protein 5 [Onychostruthus taczanowskii]